MTADNYQCRMYDITNNHPVMMPSRSFDSKPGVGEFCNVNGELFEIIGIFHQAVFGEVELYVKKRAEDCDCRTIASVILGKRG